MSWEERMAKKRRAASPRYGDRGDPLPPGRCVDCWGAFYKWDGNRWRVIHEPMPAGETCRCGCHDGEVWLANLHGIPHTGHRSPGIAPGGGL